MKKIATLVALIVWLVLPVYAATEQIVVHTNYTGGTAGRVCHFALRDGVTYVPLYYRVQALNNSADTTEPAPTTNCPASPTVGNIEFGVFAPPTYIYEYKYKCGDMGTNEANVARIFNVPGLVSRTIGPAAPNTHYGWIRAFSAYEVTNAAYYNDAQYPPFLCDSTGFVNYPTNGGATVSLDKVNPAFMLLHFDGIVAISNALPGVGWWPVTGQVGNVSIPGANNILSQDLFAVYWRTNYLAWTCAWVKVDLFGWTGDGSFTGRYPGGSDFIVAPATGAGNMPNSELIGAQGPFKPVVVPVPEPALALAGMVALALIRKVR